MYYFHNQNKCLPLKFRKKKKKNKDTDRQKSQTLQWSVFKEHEHKEATLDSK